jgi:glutamate synthase domain-containing protein 2
MDNNYSVEEILRAIDDLQKIKKEKKIISVKNTSKTDSSTIPKDTLKLIEEAEKNKI